MVRMRTRFDLLEEIDKITWEMLYERHRHGTPVESRGQCELCEADTQVGRPSVMNARAK